MARALNESMTCDICGTDKRVESFTIVAPEGAAVIDLCVGDAKPLRKFFDAGSQEPRQRLNARRASGHAIIPVD